MKISRETLIHALGAAVNERELYERQVYQTFEDSPYLTLLKDTLKALGLGEDIEVD